MHRPAQGQMARVLLAEFVGTAFLLMGVVGGAFAAASLTDDAGLELLIGALVTGFVLITVILALQEVSGAHLNPAVTLAERLRGAIDTPTAIGYAIAQVLGGLVGTVLANLMFSSGAAVVSQIERGGGAILLAEMIATLGLVLVIQSTVLSGRSRAVAYAVGTYIAAAYFFTSSTSFANPAVTIARGFTEAPAGIAPSSAPAFIAVQSVGAVIAFGLAVAIFRSRVAE